jgi:hypothetical protein
VKEVLIRGVSRSPSPKKRARDSECWNNWITTKNFNLLQDYHAFVVLTISDEQTKNCLWCWPAVHPGNQYRWNAWLRPKWQNRGMLIKPKDPVALAELLKRSWQNLISSETMGMNSLQVARHGTSTMHEKRWSPLLNRLMSTHLIKFCAW